MIDKIRKCLNTDIYRDKRFIGGNRLLNTAVLIPLIKVDDTYHIVFQVRSQFVNQPGEISLPGGRYEAYDTYLANTAVRETAEELGISKDKIEIVGELGSLIMATSIRVDAFVGLLNIRSIDGLDINEKEVESVFTVPLTYFLTNDPLVYQIRQEIHPYIYNTQNELEVLFPAKELGLPKMYHKPWGNDRRKIYVYKTNNQVIWGITGEIIYEFASLLKS